MEGSFFLCHVATAAAQRDSSTYGTAVLVSLLQQQVLHSRKGGGWVGGWVDGWVEEGRQGTAGLEVKLHLE